MPKIVYNFSRHRIKYPLDFFDLFQIKERFYPKCDYIEKFSKLGIYCKSYELHTDKLSTWATYKNVTFLML